MSPVNRRIALLAAAGLVVFSVVAAVLMRLMPSPLRPTDYLLIGTAATLAMLAALFVAIVTGWLKMRDLFFRRRPRAGR